MPAKLLLALALTAGMLQPVVAQTGMRSLTGLVTDKQGNTLPGATVQIENTATLMVRSYITGKDGRYYFNELSEGDDYTVFCKYRKWRSETKTLSKFNSDPHPEINLRIPID